ncbi:hypothetical protein [Cerasicoccus fimbriatus]|uniref:hypothetical protein n=1 Tax=Cerasicoccus fimbriatus TaxID=3014554 RepID=UPI0022B3725C|nr:hypothetical protein [Cerasicoccus sp. TK19100]
MKNVLIIACAALMQAACTNNEVWASSDSPLAGEMGVESPASSRPSLILKNEGTVVEVRRAVAIAREEDTLISMRVVRDSYRRLPHGAHLDLLVYGQDNRLIESKTELLRSHQFNVSPNGSFLPANINTSIGSHREDITVVEITVHSEKHTDHSIALDDHEKD